MAFAAANPMLFRLMFSRERTEAAKVVREAHFATVAAAIPDASAEVKIRMSDFAWATVHGFISLVLESQIGGAEIGAQALKARGLAILSAMAETVMRAGGAPPDSSMCLKPDVETQVVRVAVDRPGVEALVQAFRRWPGSPVVTARCRDRS